jgi:Tfp pilus assembly protein PilX
MNRFPIFMDTKSRICHQHGATLIITLILLLALTLIALAAYQSSHLNQKVVANAQFQREMVLQAQQAIEAGLNDYTRFQNPTAVQNAPNTGFDANQPNSVNILVSTGAANCMSSTPAQGESQNAVTNTAAPTASGSSTVALMTDTYWQLTATASDPSTQARATVVQGVKIRSNDLNCP